MSDVHDDLVTNTPLSLVFAGSHLKTIKLPLFRDLMFIIELSW